MRERQPQRLPILLGVMAALLAHLAGGAASAQNSEPGVPKAVPGGKALRRSDVKQIFVPAQQPKSWPKGNWEIVGSQEYRRLLEGLKPDQPQPSPARILHAKYQALFTGKNFRAGRLEARIQQTSAQRFLSLDPFNLALTSLWWEEEGQPREAIWGNAVSGETLLALPRETNPSQASAASQEWTLRGEWGAAGRQFSKRFEFDLQLMPAAVNELDLFLPRGWTLQCSAGHVEGPWEIPQHLATSPVPPAQQSRFRHWKVRMGSEQKCQVTLHQSRPGRTAQPLLLAESDTTYLIHEQELQVEARYELDVAFAPISQVVFDVPRAIRVFSVTYGGESNLEWHLKQRGIRQQVVIQLPDLLLGKSRPLRIQGLGSVDSDAPWKLPTITCSQAALLRGELHLTVDAPLELRSYQTTGFRQTAISVLPDQQETLTFSQIACDAHASFTATIGTPAFSAAAQIVSDLTTGTEEWQMRSGITWSVQAGSTFRSTCEILPEWEILDVRRASESSAPVIADWRVSKSQKGEPARLEIEFLDALTPMQSKRVLVLARRLPLTFGQSMSLACVKPLDCRSVEQFLSVRSSKRNILVSDPTSNIQPWKSENFPAFVQQSSLFSPPSSSMTRPDAQYFYSKNSPSEAKLSLNTNEPPYEATVNVLVEYTNEHIQETLELSIEPLDTPIDRLSLFATDLAEDWTWELQSEQRIPVEDPIQVDSQQNPASQGEERGGWELRLPTPQTKPFQLIASRQRDLTPKYRPALPFLPAAHELESTVEVKAASDVALDVQTTALQEESNSKTIEPMASTGVRRWHYRTPDASLTVERLAQDAVKKPLLGRLRVSSLVNGYSGSAIHHAQYHLEPHPQHTNFSFRLPKDGKLIEVLLNEKPAFPREGEDGLIRLPLRSQEKHQIEIRYESAWETEGMVSSQGLPLPQTDVTIMDFLWQFGISPNLQLAKSPTGLSLTTALPSTHWTTRFFGPWGRGSKSEFFRPWRWSAWTTWFTRDSHQAEKDAGPAPSDFFPADWFVYEARGPRASQAIELVVWNHPRALRWAWIALLTSLIVGIALRIPAWSYRRQVGLFWCLVNFAGAGLLPMPWALLAGGCLTGTLIALLFPRRFLSLRSKPAPASLPSGSTASFQHQPVITLALFFGVGGLWTLALCNLGFPQSARGQDSSLPEAASKEQQDFPTQPFNVMIPVETPRNPQFNSSIVYVDRAFLKQLRNAQPQPRSAVSYLISSAKYETQVDSQNAVEITATFEVVVLNPDQPVTVRLPIDKAFLGGPGHCLVDGQSHPVLLNTEAAGYLVELAPQNAQTANRPAIAEKRRTAFSNSGQLETRQIQLRLHGVATSLPNGGQFSFSVPAVSSSEFLVRLPEPFASIGLRGLPGQLHSATEAKAFRAKIGATKKLEVFWSQQPHLAPPTSKQSPKVFALATIYPLRIEWQIRVNSVPKSGFSSPSWMLPANTLVRDVKSERLQSYEVLPGKGHTRLLMEFQDPLLTEFTVDINCMTPRDQSSAAPPLEVQIPALNLFGDDSQETLLPEPEYQIGVLSTPELAIGPPGIDFLAKSDIQAIPSDKFVSAYRQAAAETQTLRTPQFAWKLSKPSPLELTQQPRRPMRRVRLNQEGRIHQRELRWTLTAEIDTTTAAAFRHIFRLPEGVIVDSVSVQEDETERLVRWSQSETRLELVLSDGTTGSQSVNLTGHLPIVLETGNQIPLPLIQVEDAEIVDSRLRVYQDHHATHKLQLAGLADLPALDANGSEAERGIPRLLAGVHLTDGGASPVLTVGGPLQPIRLDQALFIAPQSPNRYQLTTLIHFKELEDSPQRLTIHLPTSMTKEFRVEFSQHPGEIVPYETITQSDQSLDLVFESMVLEEQSVLRIESVVKVSKPNSWKIPQIEVTQAQVEDSLLGIAPEFTVQSAERDPAPQSIPPEETPPWVLQHQEGDPKTPGIPLYRNPAESWRLIPAQSRNENLSHQPSIHTNLWLTDSQGIVGQTYVKLPPGVQQSMAWYWPDQTSLRGAVLDGMVLSPKLDEESQTLELSLPASGQLAPASNQRTLELHWAQELAKPLPRFGQLDLMIPKPQSEEFHSATLTVLPPDQTRLIPEQGLNPEASAEPEAAASSSLESLAGNLPLHGEEWSLSFWTMDSRAETVLLVCVLVLVLGGVMHWGMRLNTGEWLHRHPAVAWGVLGLMWWTCLVGSAFGFAVLLLSPIFALAARFKPAHSSNA